ncbi:MAG: hypothetical protein K0S44_870 [Bacteroidetes bacterium]|jgi:tetratricopeptide (TPR) repeat protein|nr:hypothetical protein [Bacteroidota bacterium]
MANHHIISFIQHLSPVEIRQVDDYLSKSSALFSKDEEGKELRLFKFLISNKHKNITEEDINLEIQTASLSHLKSNLFSKVLEALTLDKYIHNSDVFSQNDIINFSLRKKILVCKIALRTLNPGKFETIIELLNEIIEKAKDFELYDILVEALNNKKYFQSPRSGSLDFEKIDKEIEYYQYCYKAVLNATDNYYRLILNNDFIKTLSENEANDHIISSIRQMEADYKKTKSEQVNYYLYIMRFALAERKKEYDQAIKYCNELIVILKKNKAIYRTERLGFVHDNLSLYKTYLKKYGEASKEAKEAQKYYIENSFNHAVSKQHEFYVNFYNKNYHAANKCLNELLSHSRIDTGEFRRSKYVYFRACAFFAERDYKGALTLLNESLEIEKDKTRWNISLRILNIMIFIEMNKINEAGNSLESLRKYIERTGKTDEVSARNIMTVKLLREIEKDGFEYNPNNKTVQKMIKDLSLVDSELSLEYFSSELIPFHEWLVSKKK